MSAIKKPKPPRMESLNAVGKAIDAAFLRRGGETNQERKRAFRKTGVSRESKMTQERLKELFNLDPETGILYWRVNRAGMKAGAIAGNSGVDRYHYIGVDYRNYKRSRLVFLFCHGFLPKDVDHINRIRSDDRPCNLRGATRSQNMGNGIWPNKSGLPKGVRKRHGTFQAVICINGRGVRLGKFATPGLAHQAYCIAASKYFGEFARFGKES